MDNLPAKGLAGCSRVPSYAQCGCHISRDWAPDLSTVQLSVPVQRLKGHERLLDAGEVGETKKQTNHRGKRCR
jgi:hypothetical protein